MWNHASHAGLLLLSLSTVYWNILFCCLAQDAHCLHRCEAAVGVDPPRMALRYTASQLFNLNGRLDLANDIRALCSHVGILRPKRYIQRQGIVFYVQHLNLLLIRDFGANPIDCSLDLQGLIFITYQHSGVWRLHRIHLLPRVC